MEKMERPEVAHTANTKGGGELVLWVKVLATKIGGLSLIPGSYTV